MEFTNYPLCCHWGGQLMEKDGNVEYLGGQRNFAIVGSNMRLSEVFSKLYEASNCDSRVMDLKVKMRFPIPGAWLAMPLENEQSLGAMWTVVKQISAPSMQVYVEHVPKDGCRPNMGAPTPTSHENSHLSSQNNSPSPTHSPHGANVHCSQITSPPTTKTPSSSTRRYNSLDPQNVDVFGYDDIDEDADKDDNKDLFEARDDIIKSSAPSQDFNTIVELDPQLQDSWRTWSRDSSLTLEDELCVGQEFDTLQQLKDMLKLYSIKRKHSFRVVEVESCKYVVECRRKVDCSCSWRLRAKKVYADLPIFKIVKYNGPHSPTCVGDMESIDHPHLTSDFVGRHIRERVKADSSLKIKHIIEVIRKQFHYTITYKRAWSAKQKAIADVFGDWDKSYEELPKFMQALKESNPGTVLHWCTKPTSDHSIHVFQRVFWAFRPSIEGFKHCRPVISIDGTDLYGKYEGTLLMAIAMDGYNQLFPLAFAIVEGENGESWPWFMACVRSITEGMNLCVISDRHPGIKKAMTEPNSGWEFPHAHHRLCIRHLASDVNTQFKSAEVKNLFGKAAEQHQKKKFDGYLNKVRGLNANAHQFLAQIPSCQWSIHHDGGFRYGIKTTNMSECLNSVMKGARFLPIKAIVQESFYRVNAYFVERRGRGKRILAENHEYTELASTTISENMTKAGFHEVRPYDHERDLYQVVTRGGNRAARKRGNAHTVDLKKHTCTCQKVEIYKLPCSHVLAVCRFCSLSYASFVDRCYTATEYRETYNKCFIPIPDMPYWTPYKGPILIPDHSLKRGKGRPRSTRIHNEMVDAASQRKVTCSICHQSGHNKKTCSRRGTNASNK